MNSVSQRLAAGPSPDRLRGAPPRAVEAAREPVVVDQDPQEAPTELLGRAVRNVPSSSRLLGRVQEGGRRVLDRASGAGVALLSTEQAALARTDATAEKSVHDYLREIDAVKAQLDNHKKEADGFNTFASKIDRRIKDAEAKQEQAIDLYEEAQKTYTTLLGVARESESGRKAIKIHEARLKFAELEARMNGRSEAKTYSWTPSGKLTRFEQLRADFLKAKEGYFELRGEIASEHLSAVLHEQLALADARALEIARARKGEHIEQEGFDGLDRVNQVGLAVEKGLLSAYQGWEALGQINIARVAGWEPDTRLGKFVAGLSVRTGISMSMVAGGVWVGGAFEVPAAASALIATAARKSLGTATAGKGFYDMMRGALLHKGEKKVPEGDELLALGDSEVDDQIFALEAKAVVNGVKPSTLEGYQRLHAERARRVQHQLVEESKSHTAEKGGKKEADRAAQVKGELKALLAQTEARFEAAKKDAKKGDTRLKVVAGALGAFFASGAFFSGAKEVASVSYDAAQGVGGQVVETAFAGVKKGLDIVAPPALAQDVVPREVLSATPEPVEELIEPEAPVRILPMEAQEDGVADDGSSEGVAEDDVEVPHEVRTVSKKELATLFAPGISSEQHKVGLYSLVTQELSSSGLQELHVPELGMRFVERADGQIALVAPTGIEMNLGTVNAPNMAEYGRIAAGLEHMLSVPLAPEVPAEAVPARVEPVIEVAPEDPTWKFDRARSTGMFADEYDDAADAVGREPVLKVADRIIHTPDDAIDRGVDTLIHAIDPDDEITPHPDTLPGFAGRESEALAERKLARILHQRSDIQDAVWKSPDGLTPAQIAEAQADIADNKIELPDGTQVEFVKGEVYLHTGIVSKEDSIKALLNPGYKDMIRGFTGDVGQRGVNVDNAIKSVENHVHRMMNMMKVRDYMVANGLQSDPHFALVTKELEASVKSASRFGHVIYDDPYYGQPSGGQKADKVYQWATGLVEVRVEVVPGHNPGRPE